MKPELRNSLKEFIQSPTGAELLGLLINQELALEAEATKKDISIDRQVQLFNKKQGVYWVRTLINDLVDTRNGK
jgi:hypothetical protein